MPADPPLIEDDAGLTIAPTPSIPLRMAVRQILESDRAWNDGDGFVAPQDIPKPMKQ
jgi:hypothetical protein